MSKEMPVILGEQSVSLLINYLDISNLLYNKLIHLQDEGGDDIKIGDIWNRMTESEQSELLLAIRKFTGKSDDDEDSIWGIDDLNS
ncbi:hypothetical protein CWN26_24375 [Klebsiella pneumoniae]|nr:hypothetical protein [Finegoldia magna]PLL51947.1 hypothetical protein CWN26_24375 [Klebsiella pneumoniae]